MRLVFPLWLGLAIGLASGVASAQEAATGDQVVYRRRTIIDFSDVLIEGELIKPEGSYVLSRKLSNFSRLIRLRENYLPELLASPNQL